jgi:hypothetical protein
MLAYVTDLEGRWDKLQSFIDGNPHISLTKQGAADGALRLTNDDVTFVFGGDAIDRGPHGRAIVALLLAARREYGERVVLLAGNRDINKLRLWRELDGEPPKEAPPEIQKGPRADLLRWILTNTMGAKDAFMHRATELASEGRASDDESVVQSFFDDIAPGGALRSYLLECRIAFRSGATLFLHGGITSENAGMVPSSSPEQWSERLSDVDAWVDALNHFYASQLESFADGGSLSALLTYQAPAEGSRYNQKSVVYARLADGEGNPRLPDEDVIRFLRASNVGRLVVGHTPSGDCPAIVRDDEEFELVLADNSYGRIERGSKVFINDAQTIIDAMTELDDGTRAPVRFTSDRADRSSPLGKRDTATGQLVKAQLADGDYLLFRGLPNYRVEQTKATAEEIARRVSIKVR